METRDRCSARNAYLIWNVNEHSLVHSERAAHRRNWRLSSGDWSRGNVRQLTVYTVESYTIYFTRGVAITSNRPNGAARRVRVAKPLDGPRRRGNCPPGVRGLHSTILGILLARAARRPA